MTGLAEMVRRTGDAAGMLPLLKRHEIQVLLRADHALKDVASRVGVSVDTVRRVRAETDVVEADDAAEHRARRIGRPSKTAAFTESIVAWLAEEPALPTQELLRRATDAGYEGNKSAFYA